MTDQTLANFILSYYEDVAEAMDDCDREQVDGQYRLGIRRLASAFCHKLELFEIREILPGLEECDVDAWFAGRGRR